MLKVYLAGSIYTSKEDVSWKKRLIEELGGYSENFIIYDPNPLIENKRDRSDSVRDHVVPKDKKVISECDIVVAYVQKASFGTAMEIGYAYDTNKIQVIGINPNCKFSNDIWFRHHTHLVLDSVAKCSEELIWISKAMLKYDGSKPGLSTMEL